MIVLTPQHSPIGLRGQRRLPNTFQATTLYRVRVHCLALPGARHNRRVRPRFSDPVEYKIAVLHRGDRDVLCCFWRIL